MYINIENKGKNLISVFPKNKHNKIKGIPIILINVLEVFNWLLIINII